MEENETKEEKEKICYCSKLNKYFLFPFFIPILSIIASKILIHLINNYEFGNIDYFCSVYICSSLIFGGLSYFISLIKSRKDNKKIIINENLNSSKNSITLIYRAQKIDNKPVFKILLLISLLFTLNVFFGQVYAINYTVVDSRFYEILFICFLSKIILKNEIYLHQKFSIFISFIGFIFLFIPIAFIITRNDIIINIILIFNSLSYSLFLVLIKYITRNYFISPYACCLIVGIYSTIFLLIVLIIHSYIICGDLSNLINTFKITNFKNKAKFYGLLILSHIIYSSTQYLVYMTVFYFSPMLFIITQVIYPLLRYSTNMIEGQDYKIFDLIFNVAGYLILLFAILIYHETIILNFCKLNKDTKKYIDKRQKEEMENDNNVIGNRSDSEYSDYE